MYSLYSGNLQKFYSNKIDFQKWYSLTKLTHFNLPVLDRTGYLKSPYNFVLPEENKLPIHLSNLNFEQCVEKRITEIIQLSRTLQKQIVLAYSGGIDSTMILSCFIERFSFKELSEFFIVALTPETIVEASEIYYNIILPNLKIINAYDLESYINENYITIIGDPGSGNFTGRSLIDNTDKIATIEDMNALLEVRGNLNYDTKRIIFNCIKYSSENYKLNLITMKDYAWWFYFNFKWHPITFRWIFRVTKRSKSFWKTNVITFYNTEDFQSYSFNEGRYLKSLKPIQKKISEKIINSRYLENKNKVYSATRLFTGKICHDAIDMNYQPITVFDPDLYYNRNNDYFFI